MEIRLFKNLFCLCAVKGCTHKATNQVYIKSQYGRFKRISVCQDCNADILNCPYAIHSSF